MRRYALLMVLLALSPFLLAESCEDWFSSDHPSTIFPGGSFEAIQLAVGGLHRITFRDDSIGASSVRLVITKDGRDFHRETIRLGGGWETDVGVSEILGVVWIARQNLLDDRGNPLLAEDKAYPLEVRP